MSNDEYNDAYEAGYRQACLEKRVHIQALCDMNLKLLAKINGLQRLIHDLALVPAADFYKSGDHGAGLVNAAWIKAREFDVS